MDYEHSYYKLCKSIALWWHEIGQHNLDDWKYNFKPPMVDEAESHPKVQILLKNMESKIDINKK